jgi:hypothetical protein
MIIGHLILVAVAGPPSVKGFDLASLCRAR